MWKFTGCMTRLSTVVYCRFVSCRGNKFGFVPVMMFEQDRMPIVSRRSKFMEPSERRVVLFAVEVVERSAKCLATNPRIPAIITDTLLFVSLFEERRVRGTESETTEIEFPLSTMICPCTSTQSTKLVTPPRRRSFLHHSTIRIFHRSSRHSLPNSFPSLFLVPCQLFIIVCSFLFSGMLSE